MAPSGMGPMALWRARLREGAIEDDAAQRLAVEKLQLLAMRLDGYEAAQPKRVGFGLFGWGRERFEDRAVPGLYLYGGVGRGKSMLMDIFFAAAPLAAKRRVHFHGFMQEIHAGIHAARQADAEDPIRAVADGVADGATLLCFDEMQIADITDAMIVGRLFERLFGRGVVVVTTSNRHPDALYKDGLNRHLFLPFIALLKERLEIHHLEGARDHRGGRGAAAEAYVTPLGPAATAALDKAWQRLTGGPGAPKEIAVGGRSLVLPRFRNGVARASFAELCLKPLGPADYLALAAAIRVLVLDDVPILAQARYDAAKRFVTLIDALYEARVGLVVSAAAEPQALYPEGEGAFEFARTASRLLEMRSPAWSPAG